MAPTGRRAIWLAQSIGRWAFSLQRIQKDMADHPVDHLGGRSSIRIGNEVTDRLTPVLTSGQLSQVRDVYYLGQVTRRIQPAGKYYLRVPRRREPELVPEEPSAVPVSA